MFSKVNQELERWPSIHAVIWPHAIRGRRGPGSVSHIIILTELVRYHLCTAQPLYAVSIKIIVRTSDKDWMTNRLPF